MARHDLDIADQNGASFLTDINDLVDAVVTQHSGAGVPANTMAYMRFMNTTAAAFFRRNSGNSGNVLDGCGADTPVQSRVSGFTAGLADHGTVQVCSGTFTVAFSAAATLTNGWAVWIVNAGTGLITLDPDGSETVDGVTTVTLAPGQGCIVACDGSSLRTIGRVARIRDTWRSVGATGANNTSTPNTQYDLDADALTLYHAAEGTSHTIVNPGAALTCNISTSGPAANGRDQAGTFATTWIHVYWIWNGATLATIASLSAPPTGPTLPSGYTHWCYACALYVDGSGNLRRTRLRGNRALYDAQASALAGGAAGSETAVSLTTLVPANALTVTLQGDMTGTADGSGNFACIYTVRAVSGQNTWSQTVQINGTSATANVGVPMPQIELANVSQQLYYLLTPSSVSSAFLSLQVAGYTVPNGAA